MAQSFLSTLPLSVRQAYPIIKSAVKEGLASRSLQTLLTRRGLGIRRQTLLDVMRLEREGFAAAETFRLLPGNILPRIRDIPYALTRLRRRFSYTFEVETLFEGQLSKRMVTVATDDRLTTDEAMDVAQEMLEQSERSSGEFDELVTMRPVSIHQVGRKGYI